MISKAIRFLSKRGTEFRMRKLRRILGVNDDAEILRLTGINMYSLLDKVNNGGRIVLHGEDGEEDREFFLLSGEKAAREFFEALEEGE